MSSQGAQPPPDTPGRLSEAAPPVVLVVGDDVEASDQYVQWLRETHAVTKAASEDDWQPDAENVDVIVLDQDRRTRAAGGLASIGRADDVDWPLAAIGAVELADVRRPPHIDEYLVAPVTETTLRETIARLDRIGAYHRLLQACAAAVVDQNGSRDPRDPAGTDPEESAGLTAREQALRADLRRLEQDIEPADFTALWRLF